MRDLEIREALRSALCGQHGNALIVDELGLCQGRARVDLAVVGGTLHGYEIKGDLDTLKRLSNQVAVYSAVFHHVTVVASGCHIPALQAMVPSWWGIQRAEEARGVVFVEVRPSIDNPEVDPFAVAQLLWRDEVLAALRAKGLAKGVGGKRLKTLWGVLADNLTAEELCCLVRQALAARPQWWRSSPSRLSGATSAAALGDRTLKPDSASLG